MIRLKELDPNNRCYHNRIKDKLKEVVVEACSEVCLVVEAEAVTTIITKEEVVVKEVNNVACSACSAAAVSKQSNNNHKEDRSDLHLKH